MAVEPPLCHAHRWGLLQSTYPGMVVMLKWNSYGRGEREVSAKKFYQGNDLYGNSVGNQV